jgi:asparagine synthase (glutamine-hydrolysing)
MCGIAGFVQPPCMDDEQLRSLARAMAQQLRHRGPDDGGVWTDAAAGAALSSRRLAILDRSPTGHQPMQSADGRFVVVFNGELYNHREIRRTLAGRGIGFRGSSDTETLVEAISAWGLRRAMERSNGMFALAVWDRAERVLSLARDRMGEKPLYYGWCGGTFLFGSELKALRAHPAFNAEIDRGSLALFFRHKYVPAPWSIYCGIRKLTPGSFVRLREGAAGALPEPELYWNPRAIVEDAAAAPFDGSFEDAVDVLEPLLMDSVGRRMVADVPVGALLSGGIDSSLITALMMRQHGSVPIRTFTVGFAESAFDESSAAAAIASGLGTHHTSITVTPADAMDVIPSLPHIYDEPFADSSQIPTFLVSRIAREHVTVALSGDGGDEVFGGYNRHAWIPSLARGAGRVPRPVRLAAAAGVDMFTPATWERLMRTATPVLPRRFRHRTPGDKLAKVVQVLRADGPDDLYLRMITHWSDPSDLVIGAQEHPTGLTDPGRAADVADLALRSMWLDATTYLPDDILVKVDRASMAVSLEARVPYLDHRVVEFGWRLPTAMKLAGGRSKLPLRALLQRYVPRELFDRPKMGFGAPIGDWLRGPLRGWAEDLLHPNRIAVEGFLRVDGVSTAWREHLSGRRNRQYQLWDVLMFESWLDSADAPVAIAS